MPWALTAGIIKGKPGFYYFSIRNVNTSPPWRCSVQVQARARQIGTSEGLETPNFGQLSQCYQFYRYSNKITNRYQIIALQLNSNLKQE